MTLINKLKKTYTVVDCKKIPGWYEYLIETPKFKFYNYIYESMTGERILAVSIRNKFEQLFVIEFLNYIISCDKSLLLCDSIKKDGLVSFSNAEMNAAIFIGPGYHNLFKAEIPEIHPKTTVCFPIFNCEFKGDETPDETILLRRDFVSTVDWNRHPSPKIKFRFYNPKTEGGTIGNDFILIKIDVVKNEIKNLSGVKSGYMDIRNYNDVPLTIRSPNSDYYEFFNENKELVFSGSLEKSLKKVNNFLTSGL